MSQLLQDSLNDELRQYSQSIAESARAAGLNFYDTIFEMVDHRQLNAVAAYNGFPSRYPHWRWGMGYDRLSKTYRYGLSVIYELVINTNPSYAYLLSSNPLVLQKTVMAHVYGHVDFFKNNYWFSRTNRKMLDQAAHHAGVIRKFIHRYGQDTVEEFIDRCLCLDNLIDIHAPFKSSPSPQEEAAEGPSKIQAKKYMDSYVNPKDVLQQQKEDHERKSNEPTAFPVSPERDVLLFLLQYAPLTEWQKKILYIIREEAYYFAPQAQTHILNEGWASYWHSKIMTELHPLKDSEIIDFCDLHSGVVARHPGQINPYRLGLGLLRYIKKRWDEGKFGVEYHAIEDPMQRQKHKRPTNLGESKIFDVRRWHNDVTFIDEFVDETFCHEQELYVYEREPGAATTITSRDYKQVKRQLLDSITNLRQPIIDIMDANYKNRGELLLKHQFTHLELKRQHLFDTLKALHSLWSRPVHLLTMVDGKEKRFSFDGKEETTADA